MKCENEKVEIIFMKREAQFTAMDVWGTGRRIKNNGEYEQTV
jgi:hypothetical protein